MTRDTQPALKELIESTDVDLVNDFLSPIRTGEKDTNDLSQKIDVLIHDLDVSMNDPLYRVTCLQLISDLGASKEALKIIEEKKVPEKLIAILDQNDPLIIPHALKLFYRINPLDIEIKYPKVLDKLCEYCQHEDLQLFDYSIDLIAAIASGGYLSRQVLDRLPNFKRKCLYRLGTTIISSDPLMKSRSLNCLRELLTVFENDPKEESSSLSEAFYYQTIPGELRMTTQLLALCQIPIMEIRVNAMKVVSAVAGLFWAQKELAAHPSFTKWIVDRSSEACKEGKEAKFCILKTIIESKTATKAFNGEDYLKMRTDFKKGPYHVGIAEEMMMDNQQAS